MVKRVLIDSRHRLPTSRSNSDFDVQLPAALELGTNTQCFVDNLVTSHSWPVLSSANNKLYIREVDANNISYHRILTLTEGHFTIASLASELQTQLRSGSHIADNGYKVTHDSGRLQVVIASTTGSLKIYGRKDFDGSTSFPLDVPFGNVNVSSDFATVWAGANVVDNPLPDKLNDANEIIGNMLHGPTIVVNVPARFAHTDLAVHKFLLLCCDAFESNIMTLDGRSDVLKKVKVGQTTQGDVIVDTLQNHLPFAVLRHDTTLQYMTFTLRGFDGNIVPLYQHQCSFELVFT